MLMNSDYVEVTNRDNGRVGYQVPDLRIERVFEPGETKKVTVEEIRKLSYQIGGMNTLRECLIINNKELIEEILHHVEPEYFYNSEDVVNLLVNGTTDELLDALDFAPSSVVDMIKTLCVSLEIPDINKRKAILKKTGFDVSRAIDIENQTKEIEEASQTIRRVNIKEEISKTEEKGPVRRAAVPKTYVKVEK